MAKTNFTKAEEALAGALEKIKVEELLIQADKAAGKVPPSVAIARERLPILHALQRDLKRVYKHDPDIYKKLKVKRKDLEKLLETATSLNQEEWKKLIEFKEKVDAYVIQIPAAKATNDQIVEQQRHKHINKRFNVSDKWLPLK